MTQAAHMALDVLTPILVGLLLTAFLSNIVATKHIYWFPECCVALTMGILFGVIIFKIPGVYNADLANILDFHPEFFKFVLLPPVIFWSGYQVFRDDFYTQIGTICVFAFIGTTLSTFIVGPVLYFTEIGSLGFAEAMAFGALISAVDPVGTLAVFGELKVDPKLDILVFGESILNDAVSIVLFNMFMTFHDLGISGPVVGKAIGEMFLIFVGSVLIGVGVGGGSALFFKWIKHIHSPMTEAIAMLYFSLLAYMLAEGAKLSGIIASFSGGIFMGMYTDRNLSRHGRESARSLLATASTLADVVIFMTIGSSSWPQAKNADWKLAFVTLGLCLVGRAVNIFGLSAIMNRFRLHPIPWNYQVIMWHAGLRGAIAYSLALEMDTPGKDHIVFATVIVVIFTVLFMGMTTYPALLLTKIRLACKDKADNNWFSHYNANRKFLLRMHTQYLRPFFLRPEVLEEKTTLKSTWKEDLEDRMRRARPEDMPVIERNYKEIFDRMLDPTVENADFMTETSMVRRQRQAFGQWLDHAKQRADNVHRELERQEEQAAQRQAKIDAFAEWHLHNVSSTSNGTSHESLEIAPSGNGHTAIDQMPTINEKDSDAVEMTPQGGPSDEGTMDISDGPSSSDSTALTGQAMSPRV